MITVAGKAISPANLENDEDSTKFEGTFEGTGGLWDGAAEAGTTSFTPGCGSGGEVLSTCDLGLGVFSLAAEESLLLLGMTTSTISSRVASICSRTCDGI